MSRPTDDELTTGDELEDDLEDDDSVAPSTDAPLPRTFTIDATEDGLRLDQALRAHVPERSRSLLQKHIEAGAVLVDHKAPKRGAKTPVRAGEVVDYRPPPPEPLDLVAEDIPLSILFEDDDVLVVDKPKNLVVHPAVGHTHGTLVNAVLFHVRSLQASKSPRPGIVHRLDRDTTGAILVAKNEAAHDALGRSFQAREVEKEYVAVTIGVPHDRAKTIDTLYGRHPRDRKRFSSKVTSGKRAVTRYRVTEAFPGAAFLTVELETGRTHQIRVHLSDLGHPLVGDRTYGRRGSVKDPASGEIIADLDRPALHARRLAFPHPVTRERVEVIAPLPADLVGLLTTLRGHAAARRSP